MIAANRRASATWCVGWGAGEAGRGESQCATRTQGAEPLSTTQLRTCFSKNDAPGCTTVTSPVVGFKNLLVWLSMSTSDAWPARLLAGRNKPDCLAFSCAADGARMLTCDLAFMVARDAPIVARDAPIVARDAPWDRMPLALESPCCAKSEKKDAALACTLRQLGGSGMFNALCSSHSRRGSVATSTFKFFAKASKCSGCTGLDGPMSPCADTYPARSG